MCVLVLCTERTFNNYDSFGLCPRCVSTSFEQPNQRHICHHKETPIQYPDKFSVRFAAYAFGHIAHILGFLSSQLYSLSFFLLNIQNCEFCKNSKSKLLTLEHSKQAPSHTYAKNNCAVHPPNSQWSYTARKSSRCSRVKLFSFKF